MCSRYHKDDYPFKDLWNYIRKSLVMYGMCFLQFVNSKILRTYEPIKDRSRCLYCGRNVHDFHVPDEIWHKVIGKEIVLCYDCFCHEADNKLRYSWRGKLIFKSRN